MSSLSPLPYPRQRPGTKRILLVEDNPDLLELTLLALEKCDSQANIVVARDGAEALDYLWGKGSYCGRDTHEQPAFVMLDMKLPKLSGLEVLRNVRSNPLTALVPVVMLTSSNEPSDMTACYQSGANGFVCKSIEFRKYREKLNRLQDYWLNVNETVANQ